MKILLMGPSLQQNGGMATVQQLILQCGLLQEVQHVTTHEEGSMLRRWVVFSTSLYILCKQLILKQVDLVHMHLSERGSTLRIAILSLVVFIFDKPTYIHAHGAEFEDFFTHLPNILQQSLGWIFRRCDGFIVLSRSWQEYYVRALRLNPERVHVLPNPVKLPAKVPIRSQSSSITLVFCGRVGQRKGTFDLILAFAQLSQSLKERSQLIVAGDGDLESGRHLAMQHGLMDRITFLGWVDATTRDTILKQSDIFILPSYHEGFPMAILEAMAWGLPIITTPVGGIPEMVSSGENGLLVQPGDVMDLSDAMQRLIENRELRQAMGEAARETSTSFDLIEYRDRLSQIYASRTQNNELASIK